MTTLVLSHYADNEPENGVAVHYSEVNNVITKHWLAARFLVCENYMWNDKV